jgi:hypothetical protein
MIKANTQLCQLLEKLKEREPAPQSEKPKHGELACRKKISPSHFV